MSSGRAIQFSAVSKRFGRTLALDDLTFSVAPGEILGLVGQNGAGKTTALRIASGFFDPDRGRARILGLDVTTDRALARAQVGYLPESVPLYRELRVVEYLGFRARLEGVARGDIAARIAAVCQRVSLEDHRDAMIGTLSRGFRQRVGLAAAMIHDPPILLLDEPMSGLDPIQRRDLHQVIDGLAGDHTIVLSSHALGEIESLAHRFAIIADGALTALGTLDELRIACGLTADASLEAIFLATTDEAETKADAGPDGESESEPDPGPDAESDTGPEPEAEPDAEPDAGAARPSPGAPLGSVTAALVIARREFASFFHAPIATVVGVAFLVLQGLSFYAVVEALTDPARPAPIGAVLSTFFGGTFLWWTALLIAVATLAMRSCAEEKRQGTWESLVTAAVAEGPIIAGKWLAAWLFYALLWLPTLAYPVLLAAYAPPEAAIDPGPIASSYLGVLLIGAALLALGVAASALTRSQIVAAVIAFALYLILFVLGQLTELAPRLTGDTPTLAAVLDHIDLRGHMTDLAHGEITTAMLVFLASVTALGLIAATLAAVWERRRRAELHARSVALLLIAIIALCGNLLAARHDPSWDVTRAQRNSLDPRTRTILAGIDAPGVDIAVVAAGLDAFASVQVEIDRLIERMAATQPRLRLRTIDPALDPGHLDTLAAEFAQAADNLRDGGVILIQRGERRRAVDLFDMAEIDQDDLGVSQLSRFRAEQAIASAITEVTDRDRPILCATTAHGEVPLVAPPALDGRDPQRPSPWAALVAQVERDGARLEPVTRIDPAVPSRCRVLIIAGPRRPFSADEAKSIDDYLAAGGRLFLALTEGPSHTGPGFFAPLGLELVLARQGISLVRGVVIDPPASVDHPAHWITTSGYGEHPITAGFQDRRLTLWMEPRVIELTTVLEEDEKDDDGPEYTLDPVPLVESSPDSFAELSQSSLTAGRPRLSPGDPRGPLAVAVASRNPRSGARVVVIGVSHGLSDEIAVRAPANQLLAASSLRWLSGRSGTVSIDAKPPELVRLIMPSGSKTLILGLVAGALPLFPALLGALLWWRRRA